MKDRVLGLHHITAIAGNAQRNYDFYTKVLGQRLVKKTVNFDDPETYHFYFGNEIGSPGTIITFFPWEGIKQGRNGAGMATNIGYSVPDESLDFWKERFAKFSVPTGEIGERFGELYLPFQDPDGLNIELIIPNKEDNRVAWETEEVKASAGIKGFHNVTLTLRDVEATAKVLTDAFDYKLLKQEGNRYRFITDAVESAAIVDLLEIPQVGSGINAGGTNHHVAFRVKDDNILMEYREKILSRGLQITQKIDRDYFYSLYFREPGGVLFELATDNPGFTIDESADQLGSDLRLPKQYEGYRAKIEEALPVLK